MTAQHEAEFRRRHIGTDDSAQAEMLRVVGADSVAALLDEAIPTGIRQQGGPLSLPAAATEDEAIAELRALAARNTLRRSLIGQGYYGTHTPAVITRNVLENPSWYTAYTPYQPEISQGRLEALINFQTVVADLTGTVTAGASMLDESTAAAEAMLLARRANRSDSALMIVDADTFPQTLAVLETRAEAVGIELRITEVTAETDFSNAFGVFVQYPAASGRITDLAPILSAAKSAGTTTIVAADLLALTRLVSPGSLGADIAVGTTQRFGVPLGFGGPHAGYLSVRSGLERQLPGRLVGVSKDADGHLAYRLTLQTREQHIRREKATSNVCTAQVLLAVMAGMYAVYHGPEGLSAIADRTAARAAALGRVLAAAGVTPVHEHYFDTLTLHVPGEATAIAERAAAAGVLLWAADADTIRVSTDETTTAADLALAAAAIVPGLTVSASDFDGASTALPEALRRTDGFLEHEVFNSYRSETSMMRYLKRLADKDYALDRGMIPLGSCTMKLNAATEMAAVTWPEFAGLHPFAPVADVDGSLELIAQLEGWLVEVTGYDTVSLQPNAGSQGELAGLLAIRSYHLSRGDAERTVCLIPSSAHGTNAASAVLAGMRVVVVACDEGGNVDLDDLRAKIEANAAELSALMITYPSTHGVYEEQVVEITDAVHAAGGQVYIDGANMNALTGHARFGDFGGDVSHLNLHKTFCIPHGGGGPGVGPVAAKAHLAPFLPGHPLAQRNDHSGHAHEGGPISAAPFGSAGILPITWAYIRMMGESGLADATAAAVLSANYIADRLAEHYPVLYRGENGRVAHECILDLRPLTAETGVTVDDVAKRLVDYGFHAPTMSFPVSGTLMVEPTESEDIAEIDRFIDAMIQIRAEAAQVQDGVWPADDNPLVNAPHTARSVIEGEWTHAYSRETAVYPVPGLLASKYWAPVRRVDQAYGDRNLACSCPPPEAFA